MNTAQDQKPSACPCSILRDERIAGTALETEAGNGTSRSQQTRDSIINAFLKNWISINERAVVLDGYPRTFGHSVALDRMHAECSDPPKAVLLEASFGAVGNRGEQRIGRSRSRRSVSIGRRAAKDAAASPVCSGRRRRCQDDSAEIFCARTRRFEDGSEPPFSHYGRPHKVAATRRSAEPVGSVVQILESE